MMMQVTCLCPTCGRFERLRDAVACFLLQDYPAKRLLILNDAPVAIGIVRDVPGAIAVGMRQRDRELQPLEEGCKAALIMDDARGRGRVLGQADALPIRVINVRPEYTTLGHKRQALLEAARTPLVAHWDDDDLYLPWHLSMLTARLAEQGASCAKPRAAWWGVGQGVNWAVKGERPHHNVFEGQMLFRTLDALKLGGYPPLDSGQAKALLDKFKRKGLLHTWNPPDERVSYVYRWADGVSHVSARKGRPNTDKDFGGGRPLIPPEAAPVAWATARLQGQPTYRALAGPLKHPVETPLTGG